MLHPVARRSLPDAVYDQLLEELTDGSLSAGQPLPSERKLAELLGVSRPAVREALQRLAHAGFVDVRQGDSTTVRDFRRDGGFDLLPRLLVINDRLDAGVARSILEARAHVGPKVAELAARRGGKDVRARLDECAARLRASEDGIDRQRAALDFWDALVDAADSIAFRLMFNSMRAAYLPLMAALSEVMSVEVGRVEAYDDLARAVGAGRPRQASALAEDLLAGATQALTGVLDSLEQS